MSNSNQNQIQKIVMLELEPLFHFLSQIENKTRKNNEMVSSFSQIVKQEINVIPNIIKKIAQKHDISLLELENLFDASVQKTKSVKNNPHLSLSKLKCIYQIRGLFPYIFCEHWTQQECADFLWKHENTEEYQMHPLYFKYQQKTISELQEMIHDDQINQKDVLLKKIIQNSSSIVENDGYIRSCFEKLSNQDLTHFFQKQFPNFPLPKEREHFLFLLSKF